MIGLDALPGRQIAAKPCSFQTLHRHLPRKTRAVKCAAKVKGPQTRYVCRKCGDSSLKWFGVCSGCHEYDTYDKEETYAASSSSGGGAGVSATQRAAAEARQILARSSFLLERDGAYPGEDLDMDGPPPLPKQNRSRAPQGWVSNTLNNARPISLRDMSNKAYTSHVPGRMVLTGRTGQEINRVLGGGVVSGSLVLVGGEPGVGKSTLSLQIAAMIAQPDLDYDQLSEEATEQLESSPATNSNGNSARLASPALISLPMSQAALAASSAEQGAVVAPAVPAPKAKRRRGSKATASPSPDPTTAIDQGSPQTSPASPTMTTDLDTDPPPSSQQQQQQQQEGVQASASRPVLYVSGEETCDQVYDRALRMGLHHCDTLHVLAECRMEAVLTQAIQMRPAAIVVDSLQTMFLTGLDNVSGSVPQLKECCSGLLRLAKDHGITVFVIGHVTKSRDLAGPKTIEHMVDAVLKLEGDMSQSYRLLRAGKNRFGTTDEVGVFSMDEGGLHAVSNPSSMFLANRSSGSSAVAVVLDGTRVLVLEVQALVTGCYPGSNSPPIRQSSGAPKDRVFAVIINVMHKFIARLSNQNVVVNVTGGMQMREPAADLAIAVAIASSYYNLPVPKDIAAIGEIDLGGGLRPVRCLDLRLVELAKLGLQRVVIPNVPEAAKLQRDPRLAGVQLYPCSTLLQALKVVLGDQVGMRSKGKRKGKKAVAPSQGDDDGSYDQQEEEEVLDEEEEDD